MARFPRTLGEALAAQAEAARSTRTQVMSVDPLAPIGLEQLESDLATNIDTLNTDLAGLTEEIGLVDDKILDAINDANALPLTDDRFTKRWIDYRRTTFVSSGPRIGRHVGGPFA